MWTVPAAPSNGTEAPACRPATAAHAQAKYDPMTLNGTTAARASTQPASFAAHRQQDGPGERPPRRC